MIEEICEKSGFVVSKFVVGFGNPKFLLKLRKIRIIKVEHMYVNQRKEIHSGHYVNSSLILLEDRRCTLGLILF